MDGPQTRPERADGPLRSTELYSLTSNYEFLLQSTKSPFTSETVLLQLNFPAFLRDSTRAAAPQREAIANRVSTNAIALTNFLASVNLAIRHEVSSYVMASC